jgi:hypothetical protein
LRNPSSCRAFAEILAVILDSACPILWIARQCLPSTAAATAQGRDGIHEALNPSEALAADPETIGNFGER